jgi:ketosteroid isomerase-like protein
MFLLTLKDGKDDGAYAVQDKHGHKVLFLFEEEDDAERYAMMLYDEEDADMDVVEVDDELAIKTCRMYNYKYAVITSNDIVIPPKNDKLQEDSV